MARVLIVTWLARAGREEAVASILKALMGASRQEVGCLAFDVYRADEDRRQFTLHEVYADDAALAAHQQSAHFKHHVLEEATPMLESRDRRYCRPL
jgi:quinol monooxygenase YgiN